MTVCGLMILFYGITGLLAVLSSSLSGFYSAISIVIGVIYLLIAFASCFGFAGIYKEKREWVDKYVLFFIIGSFLWLVLEIIDLIIQIVYINNLKNNCLYGFCYYSFNPGPWIAVFLIGLFFQIYFCSILASYQRVLHARTDAFEGKEIMMH
ncbi:hypothetical protein BGW38_008207 [Lunasporangiospora selenospora]|uniref:Uncharacterized protein n=1 Tax=Lunasporangiospora selenospora TaxID=979761 RepID=A0A9P6FKW9_9FUNG|nr:hypothetical protein BGW38_008207 [Lunasporangiospora selenospora]